MKTGTNELNVLARELLRLWTIYSGKGEKKRQKGAKEKKYSRDAKGLENPRGSRGVP